MQAEISVIPATLPAAIIHPITMDTVLTVLAFPCQSYIHTPEQMEQLIVNTHLMIPVV
jgi:hypothetical protein